MEILQAKSLRSVVLTCPSLQKKYGIPRFCDLPSPIQSYPLSRAEVLLRSRNETHNSFLTHSSAARNGWMQSARLVDHYGPGVFLWLFSSARAFGIVIRSRAYENNGMGKRRVVVSKWRCLNKRFQCAKAAAGVHWSGDDPRQTPLYRWIGLFGKALRLR